MRERSRKKSFFKGSGFYIAVCCCVLAIGVFGYFSNSGDAPDDNSSDIAISSSPSPSPSSSLRLENGTLPVLPDEDTVQTDSDVIYSEPDPTPVPTETPAPEPTAEPADTDDTAITEDNIAVSSDTVVDEALIYESVAADAEVIEQFILPVTGDILCHYTDSLVYNEYLGDWRAHNGVDLKADVGSDVMVSASGVIESITSGYLGTSVTVNHENGYKTVYANITPVENLNQGDSIQEGSVIGQVAQDAKENTTEPHIHFEMMIDDRYVNPLDHVN